MKRQIVAFTILAFAAFTISSASAQGWKLDKSHSSVKFAVSHLVISETEGSFKSFDGNLVSSKPDFTDAKIDFSVDIASINSDNEMRDNHLKSDDFFNAEKYPKMTFKSVSFKKLEGNKYQLIGDLTIRDITKRLGFDVTYGGTTTDPWGNVKAGFKVKGKINRFDYNLKWNKVTEAGGAVVGSEVEITVNVEFDKVK